MQFFVQANVGFVSNINFLVTAITEEEAKEKVSNNSRVKSYLEFGPLTFSNVIAVSELQTIE